MTNRYIFRYAIILVIIVAVILSAAATLLHPYQQKNENSEKMMNILIAADIQDVNTENVQQLFEKYCSDMLVIDSQGKVIDECTDTDKTSCKAFKISMKDELYKKSKGEAYQLPLYIINNQGNNIYVLPLQGNGLWGQIWGYIALSSDFNTVIGAVFDHKSETPGLGAEIATPHFENQFKGKTIFQNGQFVSISVVKGGIALLPDTQQQHSVDAISGGTITSTGVNDMIKNVLNLYLPYISTLHE